MVTREPLLPTPRSWLDRIPPWLRHLLILAAVPVLATLAQVPSNGWHLHDFVVAGNVGVASGAGYLLLLLTPLTRQYGVGSRNYLKGQD